MILRIIGFLDFDFEIKKRINQEIKKINYNQGSDNGDEMETIINELNEALAA